MSITIKDVARALNLSYSSISRALNNKPGVSETTRQLVVKTAKELGYRPNQIARGLVSRTTKTIGVIIPEIINPIFGEIITGIIETANEDDYDIFLCISNWDPDKEVEYLQASKDKRVDGIIIKSTDDSHKNLTENFDIPIVCYENWPVESKYSSVSTDNFKGGFIAANHFLQCGYEKTAIISGSKNSSASFGRFEGFLKAYEEAGRTYDPSLRYIGEYNMESGYKLSEQILLEHPDIDSIFAGNDVVAFGVLKLLAEKKIKPGKDIGVIGFDNITFASLPQIRLTTINQPEYSIGRIITKLLLEEIKNRNKGIENPPQKILLEPELIQRETTCRKIR